MPYIQSISQKAILFIDTTTNNIKQFIGDSLLTTLVILKIKYTQNLISIVSSRLHSHHARSMLTCQTIKKSCVDHKMKILRNEFLKHRFHIRLYNKIIIKRLSFKSSALWIFIFLILNILLRLFRCDSRRKITLVVATQLILDINRKK